MKSATSNPLLVNTLFTGSIFKMHLLKGVPLIFPFILVYRFIIQTMNAITGRVSLKFFFIFVYCFIIQNMITIIGGVCLNCVSILQKLQKLVDVTVWPQILNLHVPQFFHDFLLTKNNFPYHKVTIIKKHCVKFVTKKKVIKNNNA